MSRALLRLRPDLVVVTEKELWPNFLGLARLFGARVLVVNGRVSDRTIGRAKWLRGFVTWLYQLPDLLCVQSSQDSKRLFDLGVTPSRVLVAGNTKVDSLSERDARLEAELAADLGVFADDTWLVAGSTHTGEDEAIIDAFGTIRERLPHRVCCWRRVTWSGCRRCPRWLPSAVSKLCEEVSFPGSVRQRARAEPRAGARAANAPWKQS